MEQGLPLYNGATKQEARQQVVQMPQLPRVQGMGEAFDRAVDAGLQALDKYSKLHDFGEQQRVEHEARLNDLEMQKGLQKGLTAKWGTRESFFNEDGTRNEDNIAAFKSRWQEANLGIQRSFMRRDSAMQDADYMSQRNDGLAERVELSTVRQEFENRRRAFDANYALAVEQNDIGGALHALESAVAAGQILPAEAARRKLQLTRRGVRQHLSGLRAQGTQGAKKALGELLGGGEQQPPAMPQDEPTEGAMTNDFTLNEDVLKDVAKAQTPTGLLSPEEFNAELQSALAGSMAIDVGAGLDVPEISDNAPAWAHAAVHTAKTWGGWTRDLYKEAVYALAGELVGNPIYKGLSDEKFAQLVRDTVYVPTMSESLFGEELAPDAAYESWLGTHIQQIMSARDTGLEKRVSEALEEETFELPDDDAFAQFVLGRVRERLGTYRLQGGNNWVEEQELINTAAADARKEYEDRGKVQLGYSQILARSKADLELTKLRREKTDTWKGIMKETQAAAKARQEAEKKPKRKTKEELLRERPYLGNVEVSFRMRENGENRAMLTVPRAEYERMCEQFECGENDVLCCDLDGKRTNLLVVPGETDEWSVNAAAVGKLAGKNKIDVQAFKRGVQGNMKLNKKTIVGNNRYEY